MWNVLAQQVMMGMVAFRSRDNADELGYSMDQWPGYAHERMQLVRFLQERRVLNPIVTRASFVVEAGKAGAKPA